MMQKLLMGRDKEQNEREDNKMGQIRESLTGDDKAFSYKGVLLFISLKIQTDRRRSVSHT